MHSNESKCQPAAPAFSGRKLGLAVLEALGVSSEDVTAVTLEMRAEGEARLSVQMLVREPMLEPLRRELAQYELVKRETRAEGERAVDASTARLVGAIERATERQRSEVLSRLA